jgi:hypothetical protein
MLRQADQQFKVMLQWQRMGHAADAKEACTLRNSGVRTTFPLG